MRMPGDRRLLSLATVHFVFGFVAAIPARLRLFGLLNLLPMIVSGLCQAFLLALWGVTSTASQWKRIAGVVTGTIYLESLLGIAVERDFVGIATFTIVATAASLLVLRARGVRCIRQVSAQYVTGPMRFSIGSLMLLIAAVALLITVARTLDEIPMPAKILPLNIFFSFCIVTVGLVAIWAVLGTAQPLRHSSILFILSPTLGVLFAIAATANHGGWVLIIGTMIFFSVTMFASLSVVRSCGYRWVRRDSQLLADSSSEKNIGGSCPV
jgi:hypothetical protein